MYFFQILFRYKLLHDIEYSSLCCTIGSYFFCYIKLVHFIIYIPYISDTIEYLTLTFHWASQAVLVVKKPPASAGHVRHMGLIPGSGRSPRGGHGNPLQYSCLESPMDRGAWWATVCGVAQSRTWLKQLISYTWLTSPSIILPVSVCVVANRGISLFFLWLGNILFSVSLSIDCTFLCIHLLVDS